MQRMRKLTPRFSVCLGMTWETEALEQAKKHLLAREETCRWCYLVGGGGFDGLWACLEKTVQGWVAQRKVWREKVVGVSDVEGLAREVLRMAHMLETLPLREAHARLCLCLCLRLCLRPCGCRCGCQCHCWSVLQKKISTMPGP